MATRRREIWICDAETDPFRKGRIPEPFIWGLYCPATQEYMEFTNTRDLVMQLEDMNVIVYAHNGGKFDWHFLIQYIQTFEPLTVIAGRLAKFKIGECEFRDSYNIIPAPLSAYKKDEIDYSIFEPEERIKPENMELIRAYLKTDCIYLGEMVSDFIETYGLHLTQASTALKQWAKMSGFKPPKSSDVFYSSLKSYYYGGRVECFEMGEITDRFTVVDIKSAYPDAMMYKHPWGLQYDITDNLPDTDDRISRCFIRLNAPAMGAFPIRTPEGLRFPNNREICEFHITGWEYLAARDTGALGPHEILSCIEFLEEIDFADYVNHFYEMKVTAERNGDAAKRLFAKIFLNSLYGKFAANPENYEEYMTIPAHMIAGAKEDDWGVCKLLSEDIAVVSRELQPELHRYYNIAVAASVTGFVRAKLWRAIAACDRPLYCDTDCIAAIDAGALSYSDKLGDWEIEAICDYGAIAGKKLYAFHRAPDDPKIKKDGEWKTASKGVRLEAKEICEIARGTVITHSPEAPTFSIKSNIVFTPRRIRMQK